VCNCFHRSKTTQMRNIIVIIKKLHSIHEVRESSNKKKKICLLVWSSRFIGSSIYLWLLSFSNFFFFIVMPLFRLFVSAIRRIYQRILKQFRTHGSVNGDAVTEHPEVSSETSRSLAEHDIDTPDFFDPGNSMSEHTSCTHWP